MASGPRPGAASVSEVIEAQGQVRNLFFNQCHGRLQVITLGARDPHRITLDRSLHLEFAVLDQTLDFLGGFGLNAIADLDHLLDLVAANFLCVANFKKAHIDTAFGQFVAQDFLDLGQLPVPPTPEDAPWRAVVPAFLVGELRRAFEMGFLLFLPFLVIDMVVASVLMSLGMMMLPPNAVSLPFKLIFFVLVDGWRMLAGSLVESFMSGPPPS